jgi:glycosyltransferase involved in cell wall biosynthesis
MLVKDEADIIGYTIEHLFQQVDAVIVADNDSTDGTTEILDELADGSQMVVLNDHKVAYWQSKKTSLLAHYAERLGHTWVVPCDADEYWYAYDGRPISHLLAGLAPDVWIVDAHIYHHFPTFIDEADGEIANPFRRIRYRLPHHAALPKVAARTDRSLVIEAGNHGAYYQARGHVITSGGLALRHYSWRNSDQYLTKIRNGQRAYAATDLPENIGAHWRMFEGATDDAIRQHFFDYFLFEDERIAAELVYDPAPGYA